MARNVVQQLLAWAVGFHVASVFLLGPIPGASWMASATLAAEFICLVALAAVCRCTLPREPLWLAPLALCALATVSIAWAQEPLAAAVAAGQLWVAVVGGLTLHIALNNGVALRAVATAAIVTGLVQGVVAIGAPAGTIEAGAQGLAGNANALGAQLTICALLIIAAQFRSRALVWLPPGLVGMAVVLTGSRQIIFAVFAIGLLALMSLARRLRSPQGWCAAVMLVCVAGVAGWLGFRSGVLRGWNDLFVIRRLATLAEGRDHSAHVRFDMLRSALELWVRKPLLGYGVDQFRYLSDFGTYAHNNYAELLTDLGILGVLLYYAQHIILLLRVVRARRIALPGRQLVGVAVLLLLMWDVAIVSYYQKAFWLLWAALWHLSRAQAPAVAVVRRSPAASIAPTSQRLGSPTRIATPHFSRGGS